MLPSRAETASHRPPGVRPTVVPDAPGAFTPPPACPLTASLGGPSTRRIITVLAFLGLAAAPLASCRETPGPASPPGPRTTPFGSPDLIFFNGQVVTVEPDLPLAQALAVRGDIIIEVGGDREIMELRTEETRLIDLAGRALLPGFVDSHNHVFHSVFFQWDAEVVGTTYDEAQQAMLEVGITTHANPGGFPEFASHFIEFATSGDLRVRASLYLQYNSNCGVRYPDDWYMSFPPVADPHEMFRLPGIKVFTDGGSCGRVALSLPVASPFGDLFLTADELAPVVTAAQAAGYQVAIHALGDRALDTALDALETALDGLPNTYRHRIEHNRIVRPDQLPRYARLGAVPVVFGQPFTCAILDGGAWSALLNDHHWAAALRPWFDPWRSLLDTSPRLRVAWHSDFRFFPLDPLTHLWSLVTRREMRADGSVCEPPEWLSDGAAGVEEALRMMTIDAAHALSMEDHIGSLRPGKLADLVILSANPLAVAPDGIRGLEVLVTMVGGRFEHCDAGHPTLCPGYTPASAAASPGG